MTLSEHEHIKISLYLDFNEANIITETSHRSNDRQSFMDRLSTLENFTSDPYLVNCVKGIRHKLSSLTDGEFLQLLQDAKAGDVMFPVNYQLPKTSEISL